jgi:DNA-binding NarL/FixJ family response regulator
MQEQRSIRILICEDQTLMREGLKTILELDGGSPPFQIIGEASDGEEAVRQANKLSPDIVLMDVQMPRQNGVQATAAICATLPATRVIILTTFDNEDYVFEAIKAGAMGYLLKDTPANELAATIRRIHQGESFIQPKVATRLLMEFSRRGPASRGTAAEEEELSQRELDVLKLLAQGASNREIARRLVLAEGTIKNHVSNILIKLHAANRTQAANMARERGLI